VRENRAYAAFHSFLIRKSCGTICSNNAVSRGSKWLPEPLRISATLSSTLHGSRHM